MENEAQNSRTWNLLSQSMVEAIEAVQDSIVTVHAGRPYHFKWSVWRPGVVVTVHHSLRRNGVLKSRPPVMRSTPSLQERM